jgi:hypothetical protein
MLFIDAGVTKGMTYRQYTSKRGIRESLSERVQVRQLLDLPTERRFPVSDSPFSHTFTKQAFLDD